MRIASTPVFDSSGRVVGAIAIFREITLDRAIKRITEAIANCGSGNELLKAVASELKKLISFDQQRLN